MTIDEAYKILGLDFGAVEEVIDKRYKDLVKIHHPDKGGCNSIMAELNSAKDIALSFVANKEIYALAIRQVKDLIVTERQIQVAKEEYRSEAQVLYRCLDKKKGTYKLIKKITLAIGLISGVFVILGTNILPVYQQEIGQEASKSMTRWILLDGAVFAFIYLFLSILESKVKENIERFKDNLNDKKTVTKLLYEILFSPKDENEKEIGFEFGEKDFERAIHDWINIRYYKSLMRAAVETILPFKDTDSLRSTARQMGDDDFSQLVILKGQEKELIKEVELSIDRDETKFCIAGELEKMKTSLLKRREQKTH